MNSEAGNPLYQELPDVVQQVLHSSEPLNVPDPKSAARDFIKLHAKGEPGDNLDKESIEKAAANYFVLIQRNASKFKKTPFTHHQMKKTMFEAKKTPSGCLSGQAKRRLGLHMIKPSSKKYTDFCQIHELWHEYAIQMLGLKHFIDEGWSGDYDDSRTQTVQNKFKKIDFFGSKISVTRSRCPNLVDATGIVIKETKNTFTIVCRDDKVKVIPKLHSEFQVVINGVNFTILGSHLHQRPVERAKHNFKKHSLWL